MKIKEKSKITIVGVFCFLLLLLASTALTYAINQEIKYSQELHVGDSFEWKVMTYENNTTPITTTIKDQVAFTEGVTVKLKIINSLDELNLANETAYDFNTFFEIYINETLVPFNILGVHFNRNME